MVGAATIGEKVAQIGVLCDSYENYILPGNRKGLR